jgi:hypothetical protein
MLILLTSLAPAINLSPVVVDTGEQLTGGVLDTGNYLIVRVVDTGDIYPRWRWYRLWISIHLKFITGLYDTGDKLITGVNDAGD